MENLPPVDFNEMTEIELFSAINNDYNVFLFRIADIIAGECFAITVNNEVVFNKKSAVSPREKIIDSMVSSEIISNPHILFAPILERKLNTVIHLYMAPVVPWFVIIFYDPSTEELRVTFYKSNEYVNKYG